MSILKFIFEESLRGQHTSLLRVQQEHIKELKEVAASPELWKFNKQKNQPIKDFIENYIDQLIMEMDREAQFSYVVQLNNNKKIIGSTRFYDISAMNKRLSIGFTWYDPSFWGTQVNPEVKLLLLQFAFEKLKCNRVDFHIDSRNQHSINAVAKLGAKQEGVLRKHKIVQGNFVRDTVLFSIIDSQWIEIKKKLSNRIKLY